MRVVPVWMAMLIVAVGAFAESDIVVTLDQGDAARQIFGTFFKVAR